MGRRHTSDATDDASQYYRLIPRGTGFPQSDEAVEKGKADAAVYTAQVNSWRHELLKAYDYTTRRENEISRIFSLRLYS